jgi:hypothetical protein|tara:strand:- start:15 stop:212 length:198 start_codon:yes stop_codon:yes gene_type:complete
MQEQNNVEDYLYFLKYRNNLTQFIIHNCSYTENKKKQNRTNFNELELLGLLKELQEISLYIEKIK